MQVDVCLFLLSGFVVCTKARSALSNGGNISVIDDSLKNEKPTCDQCSKLSGTVKHYDKHVIFCDCSSTSWPRCIDDDDSGLVHKLSNRLEKLSGLSLKMKIKITACKYNPGEEARYNKLNEAMSSFIVYPDAQLVSFNPDDENMDLFCRYLLSADSSQFGSLLLQPLHWMHLILVCVHKERDKRCGRAGPQVIEIMQKYLVEKSISEVQVMPSSHIGGHEFAGTLIAYPSAKWYGQVTRMNAAAVLDGILQERALSTCLRGAPIW